MTRIGLSLAIWLIASPALAQAPGSAAQNTPGADEGEAQAKEAAPAEPGGRERRPEEAAAGEEEPSKDEPAPPSGEPRAEAPESEEPRAAPREGETDVDIITSAGTRALLPQAYRPSIVLEGQTVVWDPRWRRFELADWLTTGALLATGFGSLVIPPDPDRWDNANRFDFAARNALRMPTLESQHVARDASDVLLTLSTNQLLVDSLIVTWWGHDADTVAFQMTLMNIQALAFNTAINGLIAGFASRERPYARNLCAGEDNTALGECRSSNRFRSFFSGHTSTTFAAAGLTCMHHGYLPLYGGGFADGLACAMSVGVAGATGMLRVMGDRHWLSDVLTGAAVGSFSGLLVPYLLHYRTGDLPEVDGDSVSIQLVPTPTGGAMAGVF